MMDERDMRAIRGRLMIRLEEEIRRSHFTLSPLQETYLKRLVDKIEYVEPEGPR